MPKFSAFAPLGMLAFSSKPTHAENIYNAMSASLGDNFAPGGHEDASTYARAMALARARYCLEHAGYQIDPLKVTEMIALREAEYGVVPSQTDDLSTRRATLAARKLLPGGGTRTNIENALRALLGSDFIAYRPTTTAEAVLWPATLGAQPMNLQLPSVARKLIKIPLPITTLGAPISIAYTQVAVPTSIAPNAPTTAIQAGDVLLVDGGKSNMAETVTAISGSTSNNLIATFTKAHDAGTLATTAPFPWWTSTKRSTLIVVSAAAAVNQEKRRKVNELMQRMARGVSTWSIVATSGAGTTGPFLLDISPMDVTPFSTVNYP